MIKIVNYVGIFRDSQGLPMACLTGDIDFMIKSYKISIEEYCKSQKDKKLCGLAKFGTLHLVNLNCQILHDNDPCKNVCYRRPVDVILHYDVLSNLEFDLSKIIMHYHKDFEKLNEFEQLDFKSLVKSFDIDGGLDKFYDKLEVSENAEKKSKI